MSRFTDLLAYKAEKLGKRVIKVPEQYTTQTCCNCGHQDTRPLSEREIRCGKCGLQMDRDQNAAINIMVLFSVQKKLFEELLIGDNVDKTEHERIMTAHEDFLSYREYEKVLHKLDQACHTFNHKLIREILLAVPAGFNPSDDIGDLVWKASRE